jgi:hypothetical protein
MKNTIKIFVLLMLSIAVSVNAQDTKAIVDKIVKEANENSQLEKLAYELLDKNGPRLVGTPQMNAANDWAVAKYKSWGIDARNEKWGEWKSWGRGITHVDMISPRIKTLEAMQLAWSPSTNGKEVTGDVTLIPDLADEAEFKNWLKTVKGKFVMIDMAQPTGRPDYNWEKNGTEVSVENMKKDRTELTIAWRNRISKTGLTSRTLPKALEEAGYLAIQKEFIGRKPNTLYLVTTAGRKAFEDHLSVLEAFVKNS